MFVSEKLDRGGNFALMTCHRGISPVIKLGILVTFGHVSD